jgi:FAD:protein FMN transferase
LKPRTIAALAAAVLLAACAAPPRAAAEREALLRGTTMGSAWTIKVVGVSAERAAELERGAQSRFEAVNQALSTYRADSALSRFNADDRGEWLDIDAELAAVLGYALHLAESSGGAYDVTVGPLVNLWGFGPEPATRAVPAAADIDLARARVGWRKVDVDLARGRARKQPGVRIDLSSLGKGRGVDRVAEYLDARGVSNYLIDLSGKLRARGRNAQGAPWRVAVERPGPDDPSGAARIVPAVVTLRDAAIATAGDYRRYFESGGRHFSHIIDPRSGHPVSHATVSATALAPDCMQADALATAFMAMTPEDALRLADAAATPALLIVRGAGEDALRLLRSDSWRDAAR